MTTKKQIFVIILAALIFGGIGGVFLNRFGIPYLSTVPGFSWVRNLESTNPVIINRREEVQFTDGVDLQNLTKQLGNYVVGIYSIPGNRFLANGIIVTSDGLILTSKTNLGPAGSFKVVLNNGENYVGQIRALDPRSELAVLTIPANNLAFAPFTNASNLQPSQRLIFIGRSNTEFTHDHALGAVTQTIINQKSLDKVLSTEAFENTIKSNTTLNPDYIGGLVSNFEGNIVGMITSSQTILISENLRTAINSYLANGKLQRPSFGIRYLNLSYQLAALKDLPRGGVLVVSVDEGSPAKKSGILVNDLIVSADNLDLNSNNFESIFNSHAFTEMPLTVLRNNQEIKLTIKLEPK